MSSSQLFLPITSSKPDLFREIQKPLLAHQFNTGTVDVLLMLTDNYLVLCDSLYTKAPTHYLPLTFSVKFETLFYALNSMGEEPLCDLARPLALRLERQQCHQKVTFYSQFVSVLDLWMKELQKKINQRNFHKLFKAKKKIGKGAFATVYLAERLRDNKMVAVKAFSKEKQYAGDKGRDSLQNEISLMRHINHSNVMKLEGVYETENSIYVILEYLEGVQLNEVLKSSRVLSNEEKSDIIRNILRGLDYLADKKIIHRDLKPQNIMFRHQNSSDAVICDFGLATFADAEKYLFVRCGTPGFVSPEIINIKDMSAKSDSISDVFSAGLIFHYLLFGHSIFSGKKYNEILSQNRACDFDFAHSKYQEINPMALELLKKMLQKDPSKRISAKRALQHVYFGSGSTRMQQEAIQKRAPFKQISYNSYMQGLKPLMEQQTPSMVNSNRSSFNFSGNYQTYRQQENRRIY